MWVRDFLRFLTFLLQVQEVAYIDKQRNIAISLGERDVKADVKAKHKYAELNECLNILMSHRIAKKKLKTKLKKDTFTLLVPEGWK